jgi:hypothetical protein
MKKIFSAIVLAAATTAASWVVRRVLAGTGNRRRHPPLENWENEGGALAPAHAPLETSQVPR